MPNNPNQLGALWTKESEKGQFMSGYLEIDGQKIEIICFKNKYKTENKNPDWEILKSKPKPQ